MSTNPLPRLATPATTPLHAHHPGAPTHPGAEPPRPRRPARAGRLPDPDERGIDLEGVMPPPPQCYYTVPIDIAVKAARIVNDGVAEFVARRPERFAGLGS